MTSLKTRVGKLEQSTMTPFKGVVRIIQDGDLTLEQERQITEAEAQGQFVIVRVIVSP